MSIKEILEELPKLTPEERQYVREWLEADEFPETQALIAAVDEGFRSSQTGKGRAPSLGPDMRASTVYLPEAAFETMEENRRASRTQDSSQSETSLP
jgi:hypothetical protein